METHGYGQFCPVALAAEIFCSRWTALIVRELLCGSTRFNELRRGMPRVSPTLLSRRLKELEQAGIVSSRPAAPSGTFDYVLTEAGEDLRPVVMGLGIWGARWTKTDLSLKNLDPSLLMLDMQRFLETRLFPPRRCTVRFHFPENGKADQVRWLVVENGAVDVCNVDPGFDVDLYVECPLRTMTAIWMGFAGVRQEIDAGRLELAGDRALADSMQQWLGLSKFAGEQKRVRSDGTS
jgi:DNA-binding HxlR family transcriptional regulator